MREGLRVRSLLRRKPIRKLASLALAALLLQGCVSDATFLRDGGAPPDPQQLETDSSACREIGPLVAGFFGGAALGAAQGAIIGASSGGADVGAIVGAGAGGVIGLVAGAVTSASGDGYDRCMAEKGYTRVSMR